MKGIFVSQINKNSRVEGVFLVKEKHMGVTKNGTPYLSLRLMDRSGDINARVWEDAEEYDRIFEKDDFIVITARSSVYQGVMQVTITDLKKCAEEDVELADFLPASAFSTEGMLEELRGIIDDVQDKYLRALLGSFFEDPEFVALYSSAPAAKALHHVTLGGLLEHSLSVARLARMVASNYENINRDLLLTGAILHDVGKVRELSYTRVFDYTDVGRLLGHITIGAEMIDDKANNIEGFPENLKMILKHMILSHHGEYLYGSPKRPKTVEALMLYYLDDLDAKVNAFQQFLAKEGDNESRWGMYHKLFDRYIYRPMYTSLVSESTPPDEADPGPDGER